MWNNELVKWRLVASVFWENLLNASFYPEADQEGARSQTRRALLQPTVQSRQPCCTNTNPSLVIQHTESLWPQPAALPFSLPCHPHLHSARMLLHLTLCRNTGLWHGVVYHRKMLENRGIRLNSLVHWCFSLMWYEIKRCSGIEHLVRKSSWSGPRRAATGEAEVMVEVWQEEQSSDRQSMVLVWRPAGKGSLIENLDFICQSNFCLYYCCSWADSTVALQQEGGGF